jgi:hypothetical protein
MNLSLFSNLYKNSKNVNERNTNLSELFRYFIKLKIGELSGHIYYKKLKSDQIYQDELISTRKIIDAQIRRTLGQIKIPNFIDIEKKKGLENIGYGCLISSIKFGNLMAITQGEASFYFPTTINEKHLLRISLLSIPRVSGIVKFEEKMVQRFSISALSDYDVDIEIKPDYVHETLSRISISVDRHWSPKYLDKNVQDLPLGVLIKSMRLGSV